MTTPRRRPREPSRNTQKQAATPADHARKPVLLIAGLSFAAAIAGVVVGGSMRNAGSPMLDAASGHIHPAEVTRSGVVRYLDNNEARILNLCKVAAVAGLAVSGISLVAYRIRFRRWPFS